MPKSGCPFSSNNQTWLEGFYTQDTENTENYNLVSPNILLAGDFNNRKILWQSCDHYRSLYKFFSAFAYSLLFFCQPRPGLWNCKSLFVILKFSQQGGLRQWVQLFSKYPRKNWYENWCRHFNRAYDHQVWRAGTSKELDSNDTNQAGPGDTIKSRSNGKLKISPLREHQSMACHLQKKTILLKVQ